MKSTTVAMRVKRVKTRRHSRSSTMAAYFQSLTVTVTPSLLLMLSVITLQTLDINFEGNQHLLREGLKKKFLEFSNFTFLYLDLDSPDFFED